MKNILQEIVSYKKIEIEQSKKMISGESLNRQNQVAIQTNKLFR